MAKIYGLFGAMTGKLADTVMSVRNGEQIARKYQPVVFNPSTPAQVAQRAKMKLMSQLSAIFSDGIGFRRSGNISARNMFTKANIRNATFANDKASIVMEKLDLTGGVLFMPVPALDGTAVSTNSFSATVSGVDAFDKVVFVQIQERENDDPQFVKVEVKDVTSGSASMNGEGLIPETRRGIAVFAYGIRFNTESARVSYENLTGDTTGEAAIINTLRTLLNSDITLSKTSYARFVVS